MADEQKNPAAVALGRLGGKRKVAKGFSKMTPERRSEIAREAVKKRWAEAKRKLDIP
jgi:hypothetical protein